MSGDSTTATRPGPGDPPDRRPGAPASPTPAAQTAAEPAAAAETAAAAVAGAAAVAEAAAETAFAGAEAASTASASGPRARLARWFSGGPEQAATLPWHRGVTVLGAASLLIGARGAWTAAETRSPTLGLLLTLCYGAVLVAGVTAFVARSRRGLAWTDLLVLATALVQCLVAYGLSHTGTDEGRLTAAAARSMLHGHPFYGQPFPWVFRHAQVTWTMGGGWDSTYAYPPLAVLLTAPLYAVLHASTAATAVTTAALVVGTVVLWAKVPAPWRSAVTMACLSFSLLPAYAADGYPALVVFALLVPVVVGFHRTGASGRLGAHGTVAGLCLGLACGAQQLAWFFTPFLLVALYALRRGELGRRRGGAVVLRYVGLAVVGWLVADVYSLLTQPGQLVKGMLLPMTQNAVLHGQGLMGLSYYVTRGSSRLDFYGYASDLLLLGLLAAVFVFPRRLGPAVAVLPWACFYLSTRSQDGYFLLLVPLWLAAAVTVPFDAFADAWQPRPARLSARVPRLVRRAPRLCAALVGGLLLVPAAVSTAVAAASSAPLVMTAAPHFAHPTGRRIDSIALTVDNRSGRTVRPHFAYRANTGATGYYLSDGPKALAPHTRYRFTIRPRSGSLIPVDHGWVVAFSDDPQTLSSASLPVPAGR